MAYACHRKDTFMVNATAWSLVTATPKTHSVVEDQKAVSGNRLKGAMLPKSWNSITKN